MNFLEWTDELSVGLALMDADHIELLDQLNDLCSAVVEDRPAERVTLVLQGFLAYARVHFRHEEVLMARYGYPDTDVHAAEHTRLLGDLVGRQARHLGGDPAVLSVHGLMLLRDWLAVHIRLDDVSLGRFLRAQRPARERARANLWPGAHRQLVAGRLVDQHRPRGSGLPWERQRLSAARA